MNIEPAAAHRVSPWLNLRRLTPARIALGRAGGSLKTPHLLQLRLDHARARDALLRPLDEEKLSQAIAAATGIPVHCLRSAAPDLNTYLKRPDLGRFLDAASVETLKIHANPSPDLVITVSEGLSALAAETHAPPVLRELLPLLRRDNFQVGPVFLVRRARVALQDHVGQCLGAKFALILLGERPGLVSPDSLGAYLVRDPRVGNTDAQRNCVSNISVLGLTPARAAFKIHWLLAASRSLGVSGNGLKDEAPMFEPLDALNSG